ncbi:unnamed protein product [Mucor fragilis]
MDASGGIESQRNLRLEVSSRLIEARDTTRQREDEANYKAKSALKTSLVQLNKLKPSKNPLALLAKPPLCLSN